MTAGLHIVALPHVAEDPEGTGSCYLRPERVADEQPAQLKGAVHKSETCVPYIIPARLWLYKMCYTNL